MAYIGNNLTVQQYAPNITYFSGNASTTAFTLPYAVVSAAQIIVSIENVIQNPSSAFTVSGTTITFTSAPPSGTNNIWVEYTSLQTNLIQPGQNTVYPSSLSISNALYWNTTGVGIGTTTPKGCFDVVGTGSEAATNWAYISGGNVGAQNPAAGFTGGLAIGQNYSSGNSEANIVWANTVGSGQYFAISKWTGSAVTEQMRISSDGYIGIGTTTPTSSLVVAGAVTGTPTVDGVHVGTQSGYATIELCGTAATGSLVDFTKSGTDTLGRIIYSNVGNYMAFSANSAELMRIDGSSLLVGTTTAILSGTKMSVSGATGSALGVVSLVNTGSSTKKWSLGPDGNGNFVVFNDASAGMYIAYGGTSWTANSDERLKTNLNPIEDAANKVSTLRAVTGRFKTDEEGISRSFLIAQDVQKVFPEAVTVGADEMLGVQYTETIPLLVAAIKEQQAIIKDLKARIETLEAK